jgi:hypothetical protein
MGGGSLIVTASLSDNVSDGAVGSNARCLPTRGPSAGKSWVVV